MKTHCMKTHCMKTHYMITKLTQFQICIVYKLLINDRSISFIILILPFSSFISIRFTLFNSLESVLSESKLSLSLSKQLVSKSQVGFEPKSMHCLQLASVDFFYRQAFSSSRFLFYLQNKQSPSRLYIGNLPNASNELLTFIFLFKNSFWLFL